MATTVKTAISMDRELFEQAEAMARQLKVSRSRLFVLAMESYIKRRQSQTLLEKIDRACADQFDSAEQRHAIARRISHRKLVEGEW